MELSDLFKLLHKYILCDYSNAEFLRIFFLHSLSDDKSYLFEDTHRATLNRYYNGENIGSLARKVVAFIDKTMMANFFENEMNPDTVPTLVNELATYGIVTDEYHFDETITDVFIHLLQEQSGGYFNSKEKDKESRKTVIYKKGALIPEDVLNTPINELNQTVIKELNDHLKIASAIASNNLSRPLSSYFKVKSAMINDNVIFTLQPTREDSYIKYPHRIQIQFDDNEPLAIKSLTDMEKLVNTANRTNQPVLLGHPKRAKEMLGQYSHPFPELGLSEIEDCSLFILPDDNPLTIECSYTMINRNQSFKLKTFKLQMLEKHDNFVIFSNQRYVDDWFHFELKVSNTKSTISVRIKEQYRSSIYYFMEFYKFILLTADTQTRIRLRLNDIENEFINAKSNLAFSSQISRNNVSEKELLLLQQLVEIEDYTGKTIQFDYDYLLKVENMIPVLYHAVKKQPAQLEDCQVTWNLKIEDNDILNFKSGKIVSVDVELSYLDIFGNKYIFEGVYLRIKDGSILNNPSIIDGVYCCDVFSTKGIEVVIKEKKITED